MKLALMSAGIACILAAHSAAEAEPLPISYAALSPDADQKSWHATLDLRTLPAGSRPARIRATIIAPPARRHYKPRITVALNGVVIARAWQKPGRKKSVISARIEDRFLSTRNHLAIALTAPAGLCPGVECPVAAAELDGPIEVSLDPAGRLPLSFSGYVTRFRAGLHLTANDASGRALGERVARAIAPLAPRREDGPTEIFVGRDTPPGADPALRFDTGPVEIRNRDGATIYDEKRLNALTILQMTARNGHPVLWVRPGREPVTGAIELDHGTVALFGARGREIAFAPRHDRVVGIAYAREAARAARFGIYWRLALFVAWLGLTAGLLFILRRMPPLQPRAG